MTPNVESGAENELRGVPRTVEVRAMFMADSQARDVRTESGPATGGPISLLYDADGQWRGPIWAPATMLLVDGLNARGEHELTIAVARRFAETCRRSGFAETFGTTAGRPFRDPFDTWTPSVFLTLANEYLGGRTNQ